MLPIRWADNFGGKTPRYRYQFILHSADSMTNAEDEQGQDQKKGVRFCVLQACNLKERARMRKWLLFVLLDL